MLEWVLEVIFVVLGSKWRALLRVASSTKEPTLEWIVQFVVDLLQLLGDLADAHSFQLVVLPRFRRRLVRAILEWRLLVPLGENARVTILCIVKVKGVHSTSRIELRADLLVNIRTWPRVIQGLFGEISSLHPT